MRMALRSSDIDFHRRILQASGNQSMLGIVRSSADIVLERQALPERWKPGRNLLRFLKRLGGVQKRPAQKAMQPPIRAAALRAGIAFVTLGD